MNFVYFSQVVGKVCLMLHGKPEFDNFNITFQNCVEIPIYIRKQLTKLHLL